MEPLTYVLITTYITRSRKEHASVQWELWHEIPHEVVEFEEFPEWNEELHQGKDDKNLIRASFSTETMMAQPSLNIRLAHGVLGKSGLLFLCVQGYYVRAHSGWHTSLSREHWFWISFHLDNAIYPIDFGSHFLLEEKCGVGCRMHCPPWSWNFGLFIIFTNPDLSPKNSYFIRLK